MARKSRAWAHLFMSAGVTTASGGDRSADLLSGYKTEIGILELRGNTIAAVIGTLSISPGALISVRDTVPNRIAIGIGVFVVGSGAGAVPVPGNDSYSWMWFHEFQEYDQAREVAAGVFQEITREIPVHIRVQRKIGVGESLICKVHNFGDRSTVVAFGGNGLLLK